MEVCVSTTDISLSHPEVQFYFTMLNEISDLVVSVPQILKSWKTTAVESRRN